MGKPNSLTVEQRAELVLSVIKGAEPLEALARRHGVSSNTLRKWRDEFLEAGKAGGSWTRSRRLPRSGSARGICGRSRNAVKCRRCGWASG